MVEDKTDKAKAKEVEYEVVKVPTEFGLAIETPDGRDLSLYESLSEILNLLYKLDKRL